jgi:hypothetical protein
MRKFRLPSPAMTVACISLAVALSGASYAAIVLPKNSVGTKQLKKNAVTTPKVKNNAITGAKVKEATLGQVPSAANADMLDGLDSSAFQRVHTGVRTLVVPAAAFGPTTSEATFTHVNYSGYVSPTGPTGSGVIAPVYLPDGSVVTRVAWYHGVAATPSIGQLHLEASEAKATDHVDMVSLNSADCSSEPCAPVQTTEIASAGVDNVNRHYGVWIGDIAADDLKTYKVVIEYVLGPQAAALARASRPGQSRSHN